MMKMPGAAARVEAPCPELLSKILSGAPGRVVASQGVQLLDIPLAADRSQGDTHVAGNPHFMLDPLNAKIVAAHIARVFTALDPAGASVYKTNAASFDASLAVKMKEWTAILAPYAGRQIVTYHPTWRYFGRRFRLRADAFLEPKLHRMGEPRSAKPVRPSSASSDCCWS